MNTLTSKKEDKAISIWFTEDMLYIRLSDGRELGTPLEWFPKLKNATESQKGKWKLIGKGIGIHWEEIDEDLSVKELL
jgi:hypothetical protein